MKSPLRNTWELYMGNFEKILVLMLTTTLPLLLLHSYIANYIYIITPSIDPTFSFADIYNAFFTIFFFLLAQVPYIRFVYNEHIGHEYSLLNAIFEFLVRGFTVFLFASIVSVLTTVGSMLFVLPGLIILTFVFPIPYISVFDEKSVWKSYREGIRLGRRNFLKIALIIVITGLLEVIIGSLIAANVFKITNLLSAQILTQMMLNLLYFPFVIIFLTSLIIKWRESEDVLEINKEEASFDEFAEENTP